MSAPTVYLHPVPAYTGPAPPDCTWGVPARVPSASHVHARGQQLPQVTIAGGYASIQKREGAADAQPASGGGGGDSEAKVRQQKSKDRDAHTRSTFKTSGYNACNIRLKADETHETCI
jgi:hypothetical protein